jgi:thymidylate kinase
MSLYKQRNNHNYEFNRANKKVKQYLKNKTKKEIENDLIKHGWNNNKRIISFSGVANSGKTTLMNKLNDYLTDNGYVVEKVDSITRKKIKKLNVDLKELRKSRAGLRIWQYYSLKEHINLLSELNKFDFDFIISDRCYIDFLIYTKITIGEDFKNKLENMFKEGIRNLNNNSLLIKTEPLNNYHKIEDGVRDSSTYYNEIDEFDKYDYDVVLQPSTIDERLNEVLKYLNI